MTPSDATAPRGPVFCTLPVAASAHVRHSGVNRQQLWSHERRGAAGPGVKVSGDRGCFCWEYVGIRSARQMAVMLFQFVGARWCTCDHGAMRCANVRVPLIVRAPCLGLAVFAIVCRVQPDTQRRDGNCICLVSRYGAQHVCVLRCVGHGVVRRHVFVAIRSMWQHAWVVLAVCVRRDVVVGVWLVGRWPTCGVAESSMRGGCVACCGMDADNPALGTTGVQTLLDALPVATMKVVNVCSTCGRITTPVSTHARLRGVLCVPRMALVVTCMSHGLAHRVRWFGCVHALLVRGTWQTVVSKASCRLARRHGVPWGCGSVTVRCST